MTFRKAPWVALILGPLTLGILYWAMKPQLPFLGRFPATLDSFWRMNAYLSLSAVRNWLLWTPWGLGFGIYFEYASPNLWLPTNYSSYPPLFVILPWLYCVITRTYPTLATLAWMGLAGAWASAWLMALWIRRWVKLATGSKALSICLALLSTALFLFSPVAWYFQYAWFADVVGIPFFCALLALDQARFRGPTGRKVYGALVFLGSLSDWLFHVLVIVLALSRRKRRKELLAPWAAALALILIRVQFAVGFQPFLEKFLIRSGLPGPRMPTWESMDYHVNSFTRYLCMAGLLAVLASLAALFLPRLRGSGRRLPPRTRLAALQITIFLLPIFLHYLIVREHYFDHLYEWMKFALAAAVTGGALLPVLVYKALPRRWAPAGLGASLGLALGISAILLSLFSPMKFTPAEPGFTMDPYLERDCLEISQHFTGNASLISPQFATYDPLGTGAKLAGDPFAHACHFPIYFATTPLQLPQLRKAAPHLRTKQLFAIFDGREPASWLPFLKPGETKLRRLRFQEVDLTKVPREPED